MQLSVPGINWGRVRPLYLNPCSRCQLLQRERTLTSAIPNHAKTRHAMERNKCSIMLSWLALTSARMRAHGCVRLEICQRTSRVAPERHLRQPFSYSSIQNYYITPHETRRKPMRSRIPKTIYHNLSLATNGSSCDRRRSRTSFRGDSPGMISLMVIASHLHQFRSSF